MKLKNELQKLSQQLNYSFQNLQLLQCALTHRSVPGESNERLEFLGDAVLSFVVSAELYRLHPAAREGELSRMRSILVNGEKLAQFARELKLGDYLRLGVSETKSGGRGRESILADGFEAIIGAIFLDGGIEACKACILAWYGEAFESFSEVGVIKDPKSTLQEWLQARRLPLPFYEVVTTGAAHAQTFYITCRVAGLPYETKGKSTSRRKAEQEAAIHYLEILKHEQ
jgi:ribonuclease-3